MCRVFVVWIVVRLFSPASHFWSQPLKPWWPDTNKTLKSWRSSKPLQPRRTQSLHHDLGKRLCDPQTLFLGRFCYIAFLEGCFSDFGLKITQRYRLLHLLGSCLFVVFLNKSQSQNFDSICMITYGTLDVHCTGGGGLEKFWLMWRFTVAGAQNPPWSVS